MSVRKDEIHQQSSAPLERSLQQKLCLPGFYMEEASGGCASCTDGTDYTSHSNTLPSGLPCTTCKSEEEEKNRCTPTKDTECQRKPGPFRGEDAPEFCQKCCTRCPDGKVMVTDCTPWSNIKCVDQESGGGLPPSVRMGRRRARLWAHLRCCIPKAKAKTRNNLASAQVLEAERPEELATSVEELNVCREQLLAREEEIAVLIAERRNSRLQLEHLEYIISRCVPSLQMTAGEWQAQSPASMTSGTEVLKALKSLFEHHKALEKKRTRDEDLACVTELRQIIEKKSREQRRMKDHLAVLSAQVTELEKDLDTARKDLLQFEKVNMHLQRDLREAVAQKEDMEKSITVLEKRYLAAQHEAISAHSLDEKLENKIAKKDSMHRQKEDKDRQLQECLDPVEQKLQQMLTEVAAKLTQQGAAPSKNSLLWEVENAKKHSEEMQNNQVQPLKQQDPERGQQASMLANVAQVFQRNEGTSAGEGDGVTPFSSPALPSTSGQADAKTAAVMIHEELDKINEDIWLIHKKNMDQRAERIESSVGMESLSNLRRVKSLAEGNESSVGMESLSNLRRFKSLNSLNLNPASLRADSCPPSRGRSKPERRQHSPERKVEVLGFMPRLPDIQEEVEDDTMACEPSTSASLPSLGLDRLDTRSLRTASDEDIRDACNSTGSQDGPGCNSNSNSSQDSLQKAPQKKGIMSYIRHFFGKKKKGRPGHTSKEALGPVAGRMFSASATWEAPGNADN